MKKLLVALLFCFCLTSFGQELGEFSFDTTAASIGRMKIFGIGDKAYYRKWTGPKYELLTKAYFESVALVADTANGRSVFQMPSYVADKIPDSSHFVIEADYIKVRSSGDEYFDTLMVGYDYYNLLRDSIELVLPAFDTSQFKSDHSFYITFYGSDSDDSLFVYDVTSVSYRFIYNNAGQKVDTVTVSKIASILYFSDTVYFYNESSNLIYASTYMSSDHPRKPFKLPTDDSPILSFTLIWKPSEQRYYIL